MGVKRGEFWSLVFRRMMIVTFLVFVTFNASGYSYYHWVAGSPFEGLTSPLGAAKLGLGVLITVCFLLLVRATWRAKGPGGMIVTLIVLCVLTYFIWTLGVIDISQPTVSLFIAQLFTIVILAIGSIWSYVWKYLTGQMTVIDEDPDPA